MKITQKSYNTLRIVAAEMIADSQIGDARSTTFCAPMMFTLFKEHYNFFGGKDHINRDRFVLADVSLTPLYYAMLNVFGINFTVEELKNYGKADAVISIMPNLDTIGVDASVNTKGQGIPTAVGLALAAQSLAAKFNAQKFNVISHYTYCFASTANLQEGVAQEAISLAGSYKLSKLILICNFIPQQVSGENIKKKYKAMGWNVITVSKTNNWFFLSLALKRAKMSVKPTLILLINNLDKKFPLVKNRIISKNEVEKMKADLGFNGSYRIDNNVRQFALRTSRKLRVEYNKWEKKVVLYRNTHPQLSEELNSFFVKPKFPAIKSLSSKIQDITNPSSANKIIVEEIRKAHKCIMLASIKEKFLPIQKNSITEVAFSKNNYRVQNLVFGNRENAMAEVCSGISLYYGAPTYVYAPICLLGQMLSGIEHAAQNNLPVCFVFFQSGNCVNQQKINIELYSQFEWLKNLENLDIYQPATSVELLACYKNIFERTKPSCLLIPEQNFEQLETNLENAQKGIYVLEEMVTNAEYTFISSGRELYVAKAVKKLMQKGGKNVNIISAPSLTVFADQSQKYQNAVIPPATSKVVVFTCTSAKSHFIGLTENYKFININDFTNTPENVTEDIIKAIRKEIH